MAKRQLKRRKNRQLNKSYKRQARLRHPEQLERRDLLAVQPLTGFEPLEPEGSLIYSADVNLSLTPTDTTQTFELELDAGQTLSVSAVGVFQANIQVFDTTNTLVADSSAAAAGEFALTNSTPVDVSGLYSVVVSAADGGLGTFSLNATLNSALESESYNGPTNEIPADAQDLDSAFTSIGTLGGEIAAVVGNISNTGPLFSSTQTVPGQAFSPNVVSFDFTGVPQPIGDLQLTVEAITDLNSSSEFLALNAEGLFTENLFQTGGNQGSLSTTQVTIPQAIASQLASDGTISLTFTPSSAVNRIGSGDLTVTVEYSTASGAADLEDWYSFSLDDGQSASLAFSSAAGIVELYDSDGTNLLATAEAMVDSVAQIDSFGDSTSDGSANDYFVRIVGVTGDYQLVATKDGRLQTELSQTPESASPIAPNETLLGFIQGGSSANPITSETEPNDDGIVGVSLADLAAANDISNSFVQTSNNTYLATITGTISSGSDGDWDFFRFPAAAGDVLVANLTGLGLSDPFLRLYDSNAVGLRFDDDGGSGLNSRITYTFQEDGDYYIVADSFSTRTGSYRLTTQITGPNAPVGAAAAEYFSFSANANDSIQIDTFTPAAGPLDFTNALNVGIEVVAPDGSTVPHTVVPGDETLNFTAPETGQYVLRVSSEDGAEGEYAVRLSGSTVSSTPFTVASSSSSDGDRVLPGTISQLTLDFSSDFRLNTPEVTDLLINGSATATNLAIIGSDRLVFDLSTLNPGLNTIELPAGSIQSLSGQSLEPFLIQVFVDNEAPTIVASSVLEGDTLPIDTNTFTFTFDEPLNVANISPTAVSIVGSRTGSQTIDSIVFDSVSQVLTVTTPVALPEDSYRLVLDDARFVDLVGFRLDGEADPTTTVPTGNGAQGGDFVVNFTVDTLISPLSGFTPRGPQGGLIYEASATGYIGPIGDIDTYTIDLDPGQAISFLVDGELQPSIEFFDPNGLSLGVATAATAGESAFLQSLPVAVGGTYRIDITGAANTVGSFNLWALLNAQLEEEERGGADNSSAASAEALDFTALDSDLGGTPLSERAGANGVVANFGPTYTAELTEGGAIFPNVLNYSFTGVPEPAGDLIVNVDAFTDLDGSTETLTLAAEGLFSEVLFVTGGSQGGLSSTQVTIPQVVATQLASDGTINFTITPSSAVNAFGSGNVTLAIEMPIAGAGGDDWYSFELQDGEATTIALTGLGITAELYASDGATLIASGEPTSGGGWIIENFIDNTSDGLAEDYFVRVVAGLGTYDLVVTRNAALERAGNNSFETAQDISGTNGILGTIQGPSLGGIGSLLGSDQNGNLISIDTLTGIGTLIGQESNHPLSTEIEFDLTTGTLYSEETNGNRDLHTIDPTTGLSTGFVTHGPAAFNGMEFVGNTLYVTNITGGGGSSPSRLEIVDPSSGGQTVVGLTGVGPISGLAYDIPSNTMFGVTAGAQVANLVTVDLVSGAATPGPDLFDSITGAPLTRVGSIEFASNGVLYGATSRSANINPGWLFSINPATGESTFIGPTGLQGVTGLTNAVVGATSTSSISDDWYVVSLNAGDNFAAEISLPGGGPGEFENPLGTGIPGGLIISEVVDGSSTDGNPKFVEITNTTTTPFTFAAGGLIVQTNNSTDRVVDIDLTGVTIASGESYVIASSLNEGQAAFESLYGFAADLYADELIGDGNDRYALTDSADGSNIIDLYGVLSVDGIGTAWEYTDGYAFRLPGDIASSGEVFETSQWFISGPGALADGSDTPENLVLNNTTPGSHDFIPGDSPLARIALFDPSGTEVAPAGTSLAYTATSPGDYRIRVSSLALAGEYYVSIDGATGSNLAPEVVSASLTNGELLNNIPSTLELTFSEALLEGVVEASDLLINGNVGALSVTKIDALTYSFEIDPAAETGDGDYTISLPADSVSDLQGIGNLEYTLDFTIDATSPIVTEALVDGAPLPLGVTFPSGDRTLSILFDEAIDASTITNSSFQLIETISNTSIAADNFVLDPTGQTLTLDYVSLSEGAYEFTLLSSGVTDLAGNLLDGEPLGTPLDGAPTGDGVAGGNYVLNFQVDTVGVGTIADFVRLEPLGGLIFASESNPGILNGPGDFDDVALSLNAGEVIAISVTPTDPTATVSITAMGLSGPATSQAAGESAILPAVAMPIDSPLTLRVVGDRPTTYLLDVYLNTSLETEANDSGLGSQLAIDDSLRSLPESRHAVLGEVTTTPSTSVIFTEDFNLGLGGFSIDNNFGSGGGLWSISIGRQLDGLPNHSAPNSLYFGQNESFFGGGDYDTGATVEGVITSPSISLPNTGGAWVSFNQLIETDRLTDIAEVSVVSGSTITPILLTSDGSLPSDTGGQWQTVTGDLSDFAGQSIRLQFRFDSVDAIANNHEGWYIDDVVIEASSDPIADLDEYTLPVTGGVPIDVVLAGQDGVDFSGATLQLVDPISGIVLATGTATPAGESPTNIDQGIFGYVPASDGDIGIRVVSQQAGRYGLVTTAGAIFETEINSDANDSLVRDLTAGGTGLGFLSSDDSFGGNGRLFAITSGNQIVEYDPTTGNRINQFSPPTSAGAPSGLAFDGDSLFFKASTSSIYELDADTGQVIDVDGYASLGPIDALAAYGGLVVALNYTSDTIFYVDPDTDTVVGSVALQAPAIGGAAGAGSRGSIFISDFGSDFIREFDPSTGAQVNSFRSPGSSTYGLAFVGDSLFVGDNSGQVVEVDPDTGAVVSSFFGGGQVFALAGDDATGAAPFNFVPPAFEGNLDEQLSDYYSVANATSFSIAGAEEDILSKKLGGDLSSLYRETMGFAVNQFATSTGGARNLMQYQDNLVLIDAFAEDDAETLLTLLEALGMEGGSTFNRTVSGWIPIDALEEMAEMPEMRFARPSYRPMTNIGSTTSQADVSMGSDTARSTFGVDGSGVTVGIISDSFGFQLADIGSGDLPGPGNPFGNTTPVNILQDASGIDEGRAMAQLVHDVAPGAELAFHTALGGQANFANGILELQSVAGADVIVDDIIYFAEPMFQDGVIAQAVDTVVANGSTYFSSAGNNGRNSWDGSFTGSGQFLSGRELHDFDPGPGIDTLHEITVPQGEQIIMSFQWDSPFFSVSGGAGTQNDLDIFVYDVTGTQIVASSTTSNLGGDALEFFNFVNRTGSSTLNISIGLRSGAEPGRMQWVGFGDISANEYATNSATSYGHANAAGAMSIGAADYRDTPAFGASEPMLESFSSAGGIPILFDTSGNPINDLRDKPNLVAPDGTNTTFFGFDVDGDGFPNFFGTSAAAPHAAAVAALMQELTPTATPDEIYDALEITAIDMDDPATPGFDVGFDSGTGAGFIDAVAALTQILADPALVGPRATSFTPDAGETPDLNITELTVEFSEALDPATASNAANYTLIEAGPDGLFGVGGDDIVVPLTPAYDNATTVTLAVGDGSTPLRFGSYRLEVGAGITDPEGNPLNALDGPGTGSATTNEFEVVLELPSGGDFYEITLNSGDGIVLETSLPGVGPSSPSNNLDAQITVYDPFGVLVGTDQDSGEGDNASLGFVAGTTGTYKVQVSAEAETEGEYLLTATRAEFVMPMDFNRDGVVSFADYPIWRQQLGQVAAFDPGDANGDGMVDSADMQLWRQSIGLTLPMASSNQLIQINNVSSTSVPQEEAPVEASELSLPIEASSSSQPFTSEVASLSVDVSPVSLENVAVAAPSGIPLLSSSLQDSTIVESADQGSVQSQQAALLLYLEQEPASAESSTTLSELEDNQDQEETVESVDSALELLFT